MSTGLRFVTLLLLLPTAAADAARTDVHVPEELRPWRGWVLQDQEFRDCPFLFNDREQQRNSFICAWPDRLSLTIAAGGGRFSQSWTVYQTEAWIPLPGSDVNWPQGVTANGSAVEVVSRGSIPRVRLAPGRYDVAGRFEWGDRPRTLAIPANTGLVELVIDGVRVARPDWTRAELWLGRRVQEKAAQDAVDIQVYRLITDDVPTRLATTLLLEVSGSVREEVVGPVLPEGFVPLAIESELPARLEPDGTLRMQVRPGSWELALLARAAGVLNGVALQSRRQNLPDAEIWSYLANDRLRVTVAEGGQPVDPTQVSVPVDWQELPAFRVAPGESLTITERSRGKVAVDNDLVLNRQLWLDFSGNGFAFSDSVGGRMRSIWRLDMAPPYRLMSATEAGSNLLITIGAGDGVTGVELRQSDVDLAAQGRSDTRGAMPVTGWLTHFNRVDTSLNLPPGHKLLAAIGADRSPGSWVDRWQLLDFFLVLIVSIAALRLFGSVTGTVALLALTLSLHETGAPAWAWLNLLAAVALVRVAPEGRLLQWLRLYRALSLIALLVLVVPFVAGQLRIAIYPQLEPQRPQFDAVYPQADFARPGVADTAAPQAERPARARMAAPEEPSTLEEIVSAARVAPAIRFARHAPNAIVQAGPGRPSWQWNNYRLSWDGPVDAERILRLVVMPRWLVTGLRFLEVVLIGIFVAVFVLEIINRRWQWPATIVPPRVAGAAPGCLVIAVMLAASPTAKADTPSPAILEELEKRLLAPPECVPRCAEIVAAFVNAGEETLTIDLELHAVAEVAVPLPGSLQGWRPEQILVNRARAMQLRRDRRDLLWLRVDAGRHQVTLRGPIPPVDSLELPFPAEPRVIRAESDAWFVAGIQDRRLNTGSIQLTRLRPDGTGDATARWESSRFPAFVRIEREIDMALDWQVRSRAIRVAPEQGALTVQIPLLEGESIISEDFTVSGNEVLVTMSADQQEVSWQSLLPRRSPLTLRSSADGPWKEVWRFAIGGIWHAEFSGVPESESEYDDGDIRVAEFYPRAGETLTLEASRPEASPGTTLAFDTVQLISSVGQRSRSVNLLLHYRSTRGAQHVLRLPDGAEITGVSIDDRTEPLRAAAGELSIPILPGVHDVSIAWRNEKPVSGRETSPAVDLSAPASNVDFRMELPRNRWVLGTSGPELGPAVLYWPELVALLVFAAVLGRIELTPLTTRHWALLGLGFSTFSWAVLAVVVVWLLASGARRNWKPDLSWWRFDLLQVAFALLTVIALASIVGSLPDGLLGTPDMHIAGHGSSRDALRWFADRSETTLPTATVYSLPLWMYKVLILVWALWLSFALLRWLPWVWRCLTSQGVWKSRRGEELSAHGYREPG